jgi:hypothetical protein
MRSKFAPGCRACSHSGCPARRTGLGRDGRCCACADAHHAMRVLPAAEIPAGYDFHSPVSRYRRQMPPFGCDGDHAQLFLGPSCVTSPSSVPATSQPRRRNKLGRLVKARHGHAGGLRVCPTNSATNFAGYSPIPKLRQDDNVTQAGRQSQRALRYVQDDRSASDNPLLGDCEQRDGKPINSDLWSWFGQAPPRPL